MSWLKVLEQPVGQPRGSRVTSREYRAWRKQVLLDMLRGSTYGQSFCRYFQIKDLRLHHDRDWQRCDHIIKREYVKTA